MPYFPSPPVVIYIISENRSEGNLTIPSDGYWSTSGIYLDSINVTTASQNWSLHICENNSFNTSALTSRQLVSGGLGNTAVQYTGIYRSDASNLYLVYNDLAGTATASFYIIGRALGI